MYMHLTNYALNKDSAQFRHAQSVDDQSGHKRSVTSLYTRLEADGHDVTKIKAAINDMIVKCLLSIQRELAHS
jgi:hypothetical protein